MHHLRDFLAAQHRRRAIGLAQRRGVAVERARIGGVDQAHVEVDRILHPAQHALEGEAAGAFVGQCGVALPAALDILGDRIETRRDGLGYRIGAAEIGEHSRVHRPGYRRLLHRGAVVARMQTADQRADRQRLLDDAAHVLAGQDLAAAQGQRTVIEPGIDQEGLESGFVLDVLRALAAAHLV